MSGRRAHAAGPMDAIQNPENGAKPEVEYQDIAARQRTEERLRHLQDVTVRFAQTQTLEEVRRVALGELATALHARGAGLRLVTADDLVLDDYTLRAPMSKQVLRRVTALPIQAEHPAAAAARSGEPVFLGNLEEFTHRFPASVEAARENGTVAAAHLPLRRGSEVFGVLSLDFAQPHSWDDAEQSFALALADRAAISYERARLFDAAQRQAQLINLSFEPIIVWSVRTGIIEWNAGAEQLYGYTRAEALGRVSHDLLRTVHPLSMHRFLAALERDGQWTGELLHTTKDGREVVVESRQQLVDLGGQRLILETNRDVTERRRLERRTRESEEMFRTLADNIPTLAWMADPDGHLFWYNQRWYTYTGTTPESQEGWGWQNVHDPDVLPQVMERWQRSLATGEPFEMVFPLRGADGVFRPFLTRVVPVKDEQGQVVRWFGTNTDITEQRETEEALRAANRVKDEFLSIASHELRTPLTVVKSNLQIVAYQLTRLLAAPDLGPDGAGSAAAVRAKLRPLLRVLERGESGVNRLNRLVSDLLDVVRVEAGTFELRTHRLELAALVREAVEEEGQSWPGREIHLEGLLRDDSLAAPACVPALWIEADPDRVRQVVVNYLSNALKYAPPNRPITIRLDPLPADADATGAARVSVSDHGPGLSPAQRAHLFERFYRVEGIKHQQKSGVGLGLGLYICKTIVERHGGQVGVESAPGAGSTFWFTLPLTPTRD